MTTYKDGCYYVPLGDETVAIEEHEYHQRLDSLRHFQELIRQVKETNVERCWKCKKPITDDYPDNGYTYTTEPPQFAHASCPTCLDCGEELTEERMEALPGVRQCVKCSVVKPYTDNDVDVDVGNDSTDMQRSAYTSTKGN